MEYRRFLDQFTDSSPFWKSSWAYLFYTILILFLGVMTFRSWSKRVKKQHEELLKQYRQQQEKKKPIKPK